MTLTRDLTWQILDHLSQSAGNGEAGDIRGGIHSSTNDQIQSKGKVRVDEFSLSSEAARQRMEETLRANAARPLFTGIAVCIIYSIGTLSCMTEEAISIM